MMRLYFLRHWPAAWALSLAVVHNKMMVSAIALNCYWIVLYGGIIRYICVLGVVAGVVSMAHETLAARIAIDGYKEDHDV